MKLYRSRPAPFCLRRHQPRRGAAGYASSKTATAARDYVGITNPCTVSSVPLCRFRRL